MKRLLLLVTICIFFITFLSCNKVDYQSGCFSVHQQGGFTIITLNKDSIDFSVSEEVNSEFDFYVNSNYFTKDRKPTCGVIIENEIISNPLKVGGCFVVQDSKPNIIFENFNNAEFLSQTHIWLLKNGISNDNKLKEDHAKKKVCRLLIGKNNNQNIVVIHSNKYNSVSMRELTDFAISQGVTEAINLDSGPSVEVFIRNNEYQYEMKSAPYKPESIKPVIYITGKIKK